MLYEFLLQFNKYYAQWQQNGFAEIREIWLDNAYGIGQIVQVKPQEDILEGIFKDIDAEGNLLLEINDKIQKFNSGEVFFKNSLAKDKVTKLFS